MVPPPAVRNENQCLQELLTVCKVFIVFANFYLSVLTILDSYRLIFAILFGFFVIFFLSTVLANSHSSLLYYKIDVISQTQQLGDG